MLLLSFKLILIFLLQKVEVIKPLLKFYPFIQFFESILCYFLQPYVFHLLMFFQANSNLGRNVEVFTLTATGNPMFYTTYSNITNINKAYICKWTINNFVDDDLESMHIVHGTIIGNSIVTAKKAGTYLVTAHSETDIESGGRFPAPDPIEVKCAVGDTILKLDWKYNFKIFKVVYNG